MACPTNVAGNDPQCGRAPRVVNNSWGGGPNNPWFDDIINAWRNVGILPIFAAGNSGPACETIGSPSDRPGAISVSSIQINNLISDFSSIGPSFTGLHKPDIAAPGQGIVSASHLTDTLLISFSGTSMAAPHITGVVALILATRPGLSVEQVEYELISGAVPHFSQNRICGALSENDIPNFHVGFGRADAFNSVNLI